MISGIFSCERRRQKKVREGKGSEIISTQRTGWLRRFIKWNLISMGPMSTKGREHLKGTCFEFSCLFDVLNVQDRPRVSKAWEQHDVDARQEGLPIKLADGTIKKVKFAPLKNINDFLSTRVASRSKRAGEVHHARMQVL